MAAVASMIPTPAPRPEPRAERDLMGSGLSMERCRTQGHGTTRDPNASQTLPWQRTEVGLMPPSPIASQTLGRVFTTALMLTANVEEAEAAILDGISATDPGQLSDERLFLAAIAAALAPQRNGPERREDLACASAILPAELRSVLHLPLNARHCFVLRMLAGLPSEVCAQLMNLETHHIEQAAGRAAQLLAGIDCVAN